MNIKHSCYLVSVVVLVFGIVSWNGFLIGVGIGSLVLAAWPAKSEHLIEVGDNMYERYQK